MAERLTIIVTPPGKDQDGLNVDDAMRHVLEAYELLISSSPYNDSIVWRLVEAKTTSPPLMVVAEAKSLQPGVDVDLIAKNQKRKFANCYSELKRGKVPDAWESNNLRTMASRFLQRNQNGVARTQIILNEDEQIDLTPQEAEVAGRAFMQPLPTEVKPRTQVGSIEGTLLEVGSYFNLPAIRIRVRTTGQDIWCYVDEKHRVQIAEEANFEDVWSGRRVRLRAELHYDAAGKLSKVHAFDVTPVTQREVSIEAIRDPDFTNGLTPSEYLDKFRDGEVG